MQEYIAGCQAFFEKVLTDLLLRQPSDPAEFLLESINAMPEEEKAMWTKKVTNKALAAAQEANKGVPPKTSEMKSTVTFTKETVEVVLRLELNEGDDIKPACLKVLHRLKDRGSKLSGCQSFEIFCENQAEGVSMLIIQTWANQAALDNYYEQDFFKEATPDFAGLLSSAPEYRTFCPL